MRERRDITEPVALRALAHPLRLALIDLVERHGTLTSAEASTLTGESTGSCSFHLRQLAKYGFLEPAEGRNRRERRWQRTAVVDHVPDSADADVNRAAAEVSKLVIDRIATEAARWLDRSADLPREWRQGSVLDSELLYVTAAELGRLSRAVTELYADFRGRTVSPSTRPAGSRAVRAVALLFPLAEDAADRPRR